MHKRKADYVFPYGIAAYPLGFRGTVISPTKICLQYEDVQCLARPLGLDKSELHAGKNGNLNLPVSTQGTDISVIAVGSQLPVLEQMLFTVIADFREYHKRHAKDYEKAYDRKFVDFLGALKVELDKTITIVHKQEFTNEP